MKLLALMPAVAAAAALKSVASSAKLDSMKTMLLGIAEESKKSGKFIEQSTKDVVQTMLDNINGTLVGLLYDDKDCAQTLLDTAYDAVEACSTARGTAFSGPIDGANTTQQNAEQTFHDCKDESISSEAFLQRMKEDFTTTTQFDSPSGPTTQTGHDYSSGTSNHDWSRTWNDEASADALSNTNHETHAQSDMHTKCHALDDLVRTFVPSTGTNAVEDLAQSAYCETPSDDFVDKYRTNQLMVDASIDWFTHMDNFEEANAADYKEKRERCHEARHRQQVRVVECNRLQHIFESDYCAYANAVDEECFLYNSCYTATHATWTADKSTVEDAETQFKAQQHALEHILCYGAQILADSTDLQQCDDLPCNGCDGLSINYRDPHVEITCDEAYGTYRPCSAEWVAGHYSTYFGTEIPVDECNECSPPVLTAWSE